MLFLTIAMWTRPPTYPDMVVDTQTMVLISNGLHYMKRYLNQVKLQNRRLLAVEILLTDPEKIQNATFTAHGSLSFLENWKPILTDPTVQISQESATGWKEAFDLGYKLRTRLVVRRILQIT